MNNWIISEDRVPDSERTDFTGNKFLTGNGSIGYRGTLEEYKKEQKTASIINGLYDQVQGKWREPVNAPNTLFCQLNWKGNDISALETDILSHRQSLDLKRGLHLRHTVFTMADGAQLSVHSRRFVSMNNPNLLCLEYSFACDRDGDIICTAGIQGDVWDINGPHLKVIKTGSSINHVVFHCQTGEEQVPISAATAFDIPRGTIREMATEENRSGIYKQLTISAEKNRQYTIRLYGALFHGRQTNDPQAHSVITVKKARKKGFALLLEEQCSYWADLWKHFDMVIQGDDRAQKAIRFSLYHLISLAPHHDSHQSIAARGLSGQVYKGAVFWDTELFMLPLFSLVKPELARPLLQYRIETLSGAVKKAEEYGFRGAFYAWESQEGGFDACTHFNVNNVLTHRPVRTFFRDKQIHISADVACSIGDYIEWTGDYKILVEGGLEVILQCCRFYLSWSYFKTEKNRYELLDVTGPDEYHEQVGNNFFTNIMVSRTFDTLFRGLDYLQKHSPDFFIQFSRTHCLEDSLKDFEHFREFLYVPEPDENGLIAQFDGYFGLEDVRKDQLLLRKQDKNEYLGGGEGLARWTTTLKQADVILALSLFPGRFRRDVIEKNYRFYEPRTEHGSSLSACAYGIVAADLGMNDKAYDYFLKTAEIDLNEGSKQYVGDLYIGGTHPAANGGAWLTLMRGFLGMRISDGELIFKPCLPGHWREVSGTVIVRNTKIELTVTQVDIKIGYHNSRGIAVKTHLLQRGREVRIALNEENL